MARRDEVRRRGCPRRVNGTEEYLFKTRNQYRIQLILLSLELVEHVLFTPTLACHSLCYVVQSLIHHQRPRLKGLAFWTRNIRSCLSRGAPGLEQASCLSLFVSMKSLCGICI